jgi:hypothetical protein
MEKSVPVMRFSIFLLSALLLMSACSAPAGGPSAKVSADGPAPATAKPAETTAQQAAAPCPAFRYYGLVDIGMTKDEADAKIGLAPKEATGEYDPEGAYYYMDSEGYGIYVLYDGGKLTSKTVQYKDAAKDLAPLTAKAVTEDQCDQIADGMAHADVVNLLGCEGAECSRTLSVIAGENKIGTIYRWGNRDGSFIQVVFLDDGTAKNAMFFKH